MITYQGKSGNDKLEMPVSANLRRKSPEDFVEKDSWTAFQLLRLDSSFVSLPVSAWKTNEGYEHAKLVVSKLPVINDAAERALSLASETNSKTCPQTKVELLALYKVIKGVQEKRRKQATSNEVVTKKAISAASRGGVEDTRLEAKAKDTKKIRGQGQGQPFRGQTLSRPRTGMLEAKAKDQGHSRKCFPQKKRSSKIFFRHSPIYRRSQNF